VAYRDRSQGFAFVYTDLAKLLRERDKIDDNAHGPVYGPEEKTINFNRDNQLKPAVPSPSPAPSQDVIAPAATERNSAIRQIRENLDRLQSLHHKLHSMLDELNQVTDTKKKK
jgi:hypothetical protein